MSLKIKFGCKHYRHHPSSLHGSIFIFIGYATNEFIHVNLTDFLLAF